MSLSAQNFRAPSADTLPQAQMGAPRIPRMFPLTGFRGVAGRKFTEIAGSMPSSRCYLAPTGAQLNSFLADAPSLDHFPLKPTARKHVREREQDPGPTCMGLVASSPAQGTWPWASPKKAECPRVRGNIPCPFPARPAPEKPRCC